MLSNFRKKLNKLAAISLTGVMVITMAACTKQGEILTKIW